MVRNVVTIQMEGIETEQDVGVRTAAVNLLVHIVMTQKSLVVPDLLSMLEKVILISLLISHKFMSVYQNIP